MTPVKGIELDAVTAWLCDHLPDFPAPYQFALVAAGGSNLTYIVSAANRQRFVLRRPPQRARLASAHDMAREYRIMAALAKPGSSVPVPAMLAWCGDASITGSEFYCMQMIDGLVLRDQAATAHMSVADCLRATESLLDAQVALHQLDLESVGLADLSQQQGYIARQLKRWRQQVAVAKTRDVPLFEQLYSQLLASAPQRTYRPGLAHGDYRFDNTILTRDYRVAAVLDWELGTIGDPVADFVWSLNYWAEPGESLCWLPDPPTCNANFPRRQDLIDIYCQKAGASITDLSWYSAFSWWKQACIVEGVYARMQQGTSGGMKLASVDQVGARVIDYLHRARELFDRI